MKPKKPPYITQKLWNKLSEKQRKKFRAAYASYLWELNELSATHNRIKAHNLALLRAWEEK